MPTGLILQPTYRVRDGVPVVQLFGRLDQGPAFLVEDDRFRPYFFAALAQPLRDQPGVRVDDTELRALDGAPLVRIQVPTPAAVPTLRERIEREGGLTHEADIRFPYRFLIDRDVRAGVSIDGACEERAGGLRVYRNPGLAPAECRPAVRVLSIDLETTPDASVVHAAALVGEDREEVHLVASREVAGAVVHADERALVDAVARRIADLDPDVITGWNVVDFDLRVLTERARRLGVRSDLGRVPGEVRFHQDPGFTRQSRAEIPGRVVLDGIPLVRDAMRLEDYRLETVAQAVLGRGKRIDHDVPDAAAEIGRLWREDPEALVAYNREDARLVLDILAREGLLALAVERSVLSGMPLDRVGASIASFDRLYLPALRRRGRVAPSVDTSRKSALVRGGAVLDSQPGLFSHVAVFDFKSLYPSLMRTFNLDPLAHALGGADAIEAPNGARFARDEAILPGVLEEFMASRERAKRRGDPHADQAIKIMMNALFGVLGAASCRFFDPEIANAITGFGQQTLHWTRDAFEAIGAAVIYGDTDSVFVKLRAEEAQAAEREAGALRDEVGSGIARRIREAYAVEPRLELELEHVYSRFFMPRVRGGGSGSKKRYAGLHDGRVEIVGLEAVRRDWPAVAGRLQRGMLERLFSGQDPLPFVREVVGQVRDGLCDAELVYAKRVRKGSLDRYSASAPPHVQAARKATRQAGGRAGPVVRYVITRTGPEPVLPGRPLPPGIEHRHYLERVLRPVADAILLEIDRSFDEALDQPRQMDLL